MGEDDDRDCEDEALGPSSGDVGGLLCSHEASEARQVESANV